LRYASPPLPIKWDFSIYNTTFPKTNKAPLLGLKVRGLWEQVQRLADKQGKYHQNGQTLHGGDYSRFAGNKKATCGLPGGFVLRWERVTCYCVPGTCPAF